MSSQRKKRRELQEADEHPQNVTVIVNGVKKVLPWEDYIKTEEGATHHLNRE